MKHRWIQAALTILIVLATYADRAEAEWFILDWMEKPANRGPSTLATLDDRTEFVPLFSFDRNKDDLQRWPDLRQTLKDGDVIAYWKDPWEARKEIFLQGKLNVIGYRLFKYGHLAMVVKDSDDGNRLRLLSSWSFTGPNIQEDIDSLKDHSWDAFRLDQWNRVDKRRFYEFIGLVRQKAEKWYGYDFSGMFGLWNSNLQPSKPEEIAYSYICSTVILAALHYAGVELDAYQRFGIADIVTPLQLVSSKGRIVETAETAVDASNALETAANATTEEAEATPAMP